MSGIPQVVNKKRCSEMCGTINKPRKRFHSDNLKTTYWAFSSCSPFVEYCQKFTAWGQVDWKFTLIGRGLFCHLYAEGHLAVTEQKASNGWLHAFFIFRIYEQTKDKSISFPVIYVGDRLLTKQQRHRKTAKQIHRHWFRNLNDGTR